MVFNATDMIRDFRRKDEKHDVNLSEFVEQMGQVPQGEEFEFQDMHGEWFDCQALPSSDPKAILQHTSKRRSNGEVCTDAARGGPVCVCHQAARGQRGQHQLLARVPPPAMHPWMPNEHMPATVWISVLSLLNATAGNGLRLTQQVFITTCLQVTTLREAAGITMKWSAARDSACRAGARWMAAFVATLPAATQADVSKLKRAVRKKINARHAFLENQLKPVVAALHKAWDVQIRPAENYWRRLDKLVRIRYPCTCCDCTIAAAGTFRPP